MSRLTINEAGTSGYTDEIILTAGDFTAAAGNAAQLINLPVKKGDVIDGAAIEVTTAFVGLSSPTLTVGSDSSVAPDDATSLMEAVAIDALSTAANTGDNLDGTTNRAIVAAADGNLEIHGNVDISAATAGKARLLLSIKRING
tara:strand:+ start:83 stop:514 length:432 start_codon:yes stop_codon:yes gene_type:complete